MSTICGRCRGLGYAEGTTEPFCPMCQGHGRIPPAKLPPCPGVYHPDDGNDRGNKCRRCGLRRDQHD